MIVTEEKQQQPESQFLKGPSCQAGFLPVPLHSVPPESLADLSVYILRNQEYSLYRGVETRFGEKDCRRLLDSGVAFVYVSVRDHQTYYRTMEKCLSAVVVDRKIQIQKKAEMLYSTSVELARELLHKPPQKEQIDRTQDVSLATVKMIISDKFAFNHLFELSDHDFYTATHAVNVCTHTVALADRMGLADSKLLQDLGSGSLLHDVGKIFIDPDLLNTPRSITPQEHDVLKKHVDLGREHLEKITVLPPELLQVVTEHHERLDGSGYPRGLKGDQISLVGRLAGIVDTFEAMTSARPYREFTWSIDDVLRHLEDESKAKFDQTIVKVFNAMIGQAVKKNSMSDDPTSAAMNPPAPSNQTDEPANSSTAGRGFRIPMWISKISWKNSRLVMEESQRLIVLNITPSGVSFLSPRPFETGQNIRISLADSPQKDTCAFIATVNQCIVVGNDWFNVNADFLATQPQNTVEKIKSLTHPGD
jgi:HD-GYP domain-containing protein (c-di-GMP phosphodiesterase class II)